MILLIRFCRFQLLLCISFSISRRAFFSFQFSDFLFSRFWIQARRPLLLNLIKVNYFPNFQCLTSKILYASDSYSNLPRYLCSTFKAIAYLSLHRDSNLSILLIISVKLSFNNYRSFWTECNFCCASLGIARPHWVLVWVRFNKARSMVSMQLFRNSIIMGWWDRAVYIIFGRQIKFDQFILASLLHLYAFFF